MRLGMALVAALIAGWAVSTAAPAAERLEKIDLWRNAGGPQLRGAAISQRIVDPEVDGEGGGILGPGAVGTPYKQADFDRLAALGANLVVFSHPGLYEERPPYDRVQAAAEANLDRLIEFARKADLFVVIAFRTGPGRSPFTFHASSGGTWFKPDKFNDAVWADPAAQDAWVAMWRYTAERYRGNPAVIGYQLMVEPNSSHVGSDVRRGKLDIFNPQEFHKKHGGSRYDWNALFPRIVAGIRQVDPHTPILVGGNGYSNVPFLEFVTPTADKRSVYVAHNYSPWRYTGQDPDGKLTYPGDFDDDGDGKPERIDRAYVDRVLDRVAGFGRKHRAPVAVMEFGVSRWAPGAAGFLADSLAAMEERSIPSALWVWPSSFQPYEIDNSSYNYLFGTDPKNRQEVAKNPLTDVIKLYWGRNRLRPSNVRFQPSG